MTKEQEIDTLFATPPERFVAARKELASAARKSGRADVAIRIESMKRLVVSLRCLSHRRGPRRVVVPGCGGERDERHVEFLAGGLQFQQQPAPNFFWRWHPRVLQTPEFSPFERSSRLSGPGCSPAGKRRDASHASAMMRQEMHSQR